MAAKKKQHTAEHAVAMPALKPELIKVAELKPHPKNPNTHPDSQIDGLGGAFDEFGITSVVVADENGLLMAGEGRWRSAVKKGIKAIPTIVIEGWPEEKKMAFMLSDNQWGKLSVWNTERLRGNVAELRSASFNLEMTGLHLDVALATELGMVAPPVAAERGALLELVNITIADPKHVVVKGEHYTLTRSPQHPTHHLFCESVISGWPTWAPLLKADVLFCPYPGVFVPFGDKAAKHTLVMVQGDPYIAGHILDRFSEAHGKKSIRKVTA